ncbi:VOC family protein [Dactylosporangium sp. NPDC049140]|uniref:VOC family protein n=1 Tax=Dactylosporangium sp. NPDC049140 TaxID=3155647 RepID=UPI0033C35AF7
MSDDKIPPPNVWPTLRATDARALITFLVDAFGFVEVAAYGEGNLIMHAELAWPEGGGIMLGSDRQDGSKWSLKPGSFGCYVVTAEPDALLAQARAAGAEITQELEDTDYGSRGFAARDPEGNLWSFGTYRGEPRPV